MESIREFLESSTIHGLSYISTTRTRLSKLLWIAVVVAGFTTAVILIDNNISAWAKSPIATSIETFPISKVSFPRVTVCPPLGTNTALNYNLGKADNSTLDKDVRNKLGRLAGELLQEEEFKQVNFRKTFEQLGFSNIVS